MEAISSPTLLLNEEICRANIRRMAEKAEANGLAFKPHMKTHQSAAIGQWIKNAGAQEITVSSIAMARYFAEAGWQQITIAFPVNIREAKAIDQLAGRIDLTLLVNHIDVLKTLDNKLTNTVKAYIEIDSGSGRTGLRSDQKAEINDLIEAVQHTSLIRWAGFYSHPGHSYAARSKQEILEIHESVERQCNKLRDAFESKSASSFEICVGDTPCCSAATTFSGIDAISPGNFVFYDLMQYEIGSCSIADIAVAIACPIVDQYPNRNELIIHGGAVHFSKEKTGNNHFGVVAKTNNDNWQIADPQMHLHALWQEHGVVQCDERTFSRYQIGDIIPILPVHSCLTANLMKQYRTINCQQKIAMMGS